MKKKEIRDLCEALIDRKLTLVQEAMKAAQEAANSETKSSAGDKYETSRAMAQQEKDRLGGQLEQLIRQKRSLLSLPIDEGSREVLPGSYVMTDAGDFYLSIGLGEVKGSERSFYAIAMTAPIGQSMAGKKAGDSFRIGEKTVNITMIL